MTTIAWHYAPLTATEPVTRCKHGDGVCETCGTTDRRDAKHRTKNGRGVVGSLRKRKRA